MSGLRYSTIRHISSSQHAFPNKNQGNLEVTFRLKNDFCTPKKKLRRGTPKNGCSFDPKAKKEETAAVGKTQRREGFFLPRKWREELAMVLLVQHSSPSMYRCVIII